MAMIQMNTYTVEEVFISMSTGVLPDGFKLRTKSSRMIMFYNKGIACVTCGINGSIFILETHDPEVRPHLNLYAEKPNGKMVLMTKDHIFPKSKGGANELSNYQTMCSGCNQSKADKVI